jgi:hypothetical protein
MPARFRLVPALPVVFALERIGVSAEPAEALGGVPELAGGV